MTFLDPFIKSRTFGGYDFDTTDANDGMSQYLFTSNFKRKPEKHL